jgi:hypothetical protein
VKRQQLTTAKIHWGRWLDKFVFCIFGKFLTRDRDAASNSQTFYQQQVLWVSVDLRNKLKIIYYHYFNKQYKVLMMI